MSSGITFRGVLQRRWRWSRLRFDWGRWCCRVDSCGVATSRWWEWEGR